MGKEERGKRQTTNNTNLPNHKQFLPVSRTRQTGGIPGTLLLEMIIGICSKKGDIVPIKIANVTREM